MKQIDQRSATDGAAGASMRGPELHSVERRYLTETELAERWSISAKTLQRWRTMGSRPAFTRFARSVRYPLHGLDGVLDMEQSALSPPASGQDRG